MSDRPETGSMRFGDDWRGDNAHGYAGFLRRACDLLRRTRDYDQTLVRVLDGLATLLNSSRETGDDVAPLANPHLRPFAECVRDDGEAHAAHLDEVLAQRNLAVAQAVAAEREACAKECDSLRAECLGARDVHAAFGRDRDASEAWEMAGVAEDLADAIRARGKGTP